MVLFVCGGVMISECWFLLIGVIRLMICVEWFLIVGLLIFIFRCLFGYSGVKLLNVILCFVCLGFLKLIFLMFVSVK